MISRRGTPQAGMLTLEVWSSQMRKGDIWRRATSRKANNRIRGGLGSSKSAHCARCRLDVEEDVTSEAWASCQPPLSLAYNHEPRTTTKS
jgi:hypothetical protein